MLTTASTVLSFPAERSTPAPECSECQHLLREGIFKGALIRERKRADRSNQSLALLLVTLDEADVPGSLRFHAAVDALMAVKRDTDLAGWFDHQTIGLIVTDFQMPIASLIGSLERRVRRQLSRYLDASAARRISIQIHVHANDAGLRGDGLAAVDPLLSRGSRPTPYDRFKRLLDISVSVVLLAILSPLLVVIAALVKWKSPGPVLFKQVRVGQGMKPFTILKFRTMHVNAGHEVHHEFVTSFIKAGKQGTQDGKDGLFKLANDRRVTALGHVLRKTSLDELPQLWNVLRGDMSLVGPRPPLFYEVEAYQPWHCRRVLEAKPGITGLWQVAGRSRTTFDEMVRLDLRYARKRSLWNDLKILLATPAAVIVGKGAV
jgi:lipopolysaccharide/colanic/teichoic acid biosynthesis glycosyltransferase